MRQSFPERYEQYGGNIKVELDLSNYATKAGLEGAIGIDTSTLASKTDLANFEAIVDDLDVNKSNTDLSKLSNEIGVVVKKLCLIN